MQQSGRVSFIPKFACRESRVFRRLRMVTFQRRVESAGFVFTTKKTLESSSVKVHARTWVVPCLFPQLHAIHKQPLEFLLQSTRVEREKYTKHQTLTVGKFLCMFNLHEGSLFGLAVRSHARLRVRVLVISACEHPVLVISRVSALILVCPCIRVHPSWGETSVKFVHWSHLIFQFLNKFGWPEVILPACARRT